MRRRAFIAGLLASPCQPALADLIYAPGLTVPNNAPFLTPDVHISYGQSWRTNFYDGMGLQGFNPQTQTLLAMRLGNANFPSGVLSNGAGVNLPSGVNGITGYTSAMAPSDNLGAAPYPPPASAVDTSNALTIGRCAVLSQQLLRVAAGQKQLTPILEFCAAYPSSTWTTGPGGGLAPSGTSWTNMLAIIADIETLLPSTTNRLNAARFRSVGWTQGGASDHSVALTTVTEWGEMEAAFDALNLPGAGTSGLLFYIGIRGANSDVSAATLEFDGAWTFVRANANGRTIGTAPWYQWAYRGNDNIHTGDYGTMREGEYEGLAKYITEDEGTPHKPLWRALTGEVTVSGQTVTVPFDRPVGTAFVGQPLQFYWDATDGLKAWSQQGFHVKRSGSDLTVTPSISGLNVQLAIAEALSPGDVLEVSYAYYGPGGTNPSTFPGVGGNLMMAGPASLLFPGKTINSWAWPMRETVTV